MLELNEKRERKAIMKTAIVYHSHHHDNTKKLLDAISENDKVTLIKASDSQHIDLSDYEIIGFASGIYYQKFHDAVLKSAENNLPPGKKVFFIYTCGRNVNTYTNAIRKIADAKCAQVLGVYSCPGFDTFGPFKLVGGIAKGRPNEGDIDGAVKFFKEISKK